MTRRWASCHACNKAFVPRFSYQTEMIEGSAPRYFCSVGCRNPELTNASDAPEARHACTVCGEKFSLRLASQVVSSPVGRKMVCSSVCRATLLEGTRSAPAPRVAETVALAVLNQKGGTGKTTTSVSLAAGLAERGYRTLLIDLDAQGNVGVSLGVRGQKTIYHVLVDGVSPRAAAVPIRKNLDVITADQSLAAAELELVNAPERAHVLRRRMKDAVTSDSPYEFVILDCAPSLSLLNQNALIFSKSVLVPVSCDYLSLVGVKQILRTLEHVRKVLLTPVDVVGVLPTLFDRRNNISKQAVASLESHFGDRVLAPIRVDVRLKEAPSHKKSIFEYAPESNGAKDYLALVESMTGLAERAPPASPVSTVALASASRDMLPRGAPS